MKPYTGFCKVSITDNNNKQYSSIGKCKDGIVEDPLLFYLREKVKATKVVCEILYPNPYLIHVYDVTCSYQGKVSFTFSGYSILFDEENKIGQLLYTGKLNFK